MVSTGCSTSKVGLLLGYLVLFVLSVANFFRFNANFVLSSCPEEWALPRLATTPTSDFADNEEQDMMMILQHQTTRLSSSLSITPPLFPLPLDGKRGIPPQGSGNTIINNNYNPYWLVTSPKLNLAVTIIPKVMCSSIREALNTIEECPTNDSDDSNNNNQTALSRCAEARKNPTAATHLLQNNNMTRVLFLRDPLERALSAYTNSVANRRIQTPTCPSAVNCSLQDWIHDLEQHGGVWWNGGRRRRRDDVNEHFMSQRSIAQLDQMQYHYILRLSSPVDQEFFWNVLLSHKNGTDDNKRWRINASSSSSGNHNQTTGNNMLAQAKAAYAKFPPTALQKLHSLYFEDFMLWETILKVGTPRVQGEVTVYDIYMAERRKWTTNTTTSE